MLVVQKRKRGNRLIMPYQRIGGGIEIGEVSIFIPLLDGNRYPEGSVLPFSSVRWQVQKHQVIFFMYTRLHSFGAFIDLLSFKR